MNIEDKLEREEIRDYIKRMSSYTPEQILKYMGEARDFFYKYMTPEGRKYFKENKK